MSLLDKLDIVKKKDEIEFSGFEDKKIEVEKELELYTREGQFYVLVVDADNKERVELERIIDQTGCFVTSVSSGIECLEQVNSDKFDLIFISRVMPRMDGVQTLRNMKSSPASKSKDAKVYIILDERVDEPDIFFEDSGFTGIVRKPIDRTVIQDIILRHAPKKMIPEDEDLVESIHEIANNANTLKSYNIRFIEGIKNFKGNLEEYKKMAEDFCDLYETASSDMIDYMYSDKSEDYMDKARVMRELCRKLGAIYLADCFDDHVNMVKDDSLDVAESNWQALNAEWENVTNGFSIWLGNKNPQEIQTGSTEILILKTNGIKLKSADINERVEDILNLLEKNRKDEAKKHLKSLSEYELEAEVRRKVDRAVAAFDKEKINTVVEILRKF